MATAAKQRMVVVMEEIDVTESSQHSSLLGHSGYWSTRRSSSTTTS